MSLQIDFAQQKRNRKGKTIQEKRVGEKYSGGEKGRKMVMGGLFYE